MIEQMEKANVETFAKLVNLKPKFLIMAHDCDFCT